MAGGLDPVEKFGKYCIDFEWNSVIKSQRCENSKTA